MPLTREASTRAASAGSLPAGRAAHGTVRAARGAALVLAAACALVLAAACALAWPAGALASEDDLTKSTTPTVSKLVGEVTNATDGGEPEGWYEAADATVGEPVPYQITGTLPSNWDDFTTYYYEFHDTQDEAIVVDVSTVRVTLVRSDGTEEDITSAFTVTYDADAHVLVVATSDLKSAAEGIEAGDTICLTYSATIDPTLATCGSAGAMLNYVYLRYSSDPGTDEIGETPEDSTTVYTWALRVTKLDATTGETLTGASFTIQAEDGRYVAVDGTLVDDPVALAVDDEGELLVTGLDAGTYVVTEVEAPDGYDAVDPLTLQISSDATTGTPWLVVTLTATTGTAQTTSVTNSTGVVAVSVLDPESATPPGTTTTWPVPTTGDATTDLLVLATLAALGVAAVVAAVAVRRRAREDEPAPAAAAAPAPAAPPAAPAAAPPSDPDGEA